MTTLTINLNPHLTLDDQQFETICQNNKDLRFERNAKGELIIMSPTGSETGNKNSSLSGQLWFWNHQKKLGKTFDSSTGFKLPNGANRSPDVSWIKLERWEKLTVEERETFPPIAPDFVLELMSPSDSLTDAQNKMLEYMENGVQLGWLFNRKTRIVEIYRQGREKEVLTNPQVLSGENVLLGFSLNLDIVW